MLTHVLYGLVVDIGRSARTGSVTAGAMTSRRSCAHLLARSVGRYRRRGSSLSGLGCTGFKDCSRWWLAVLSCCQYFRALPLKTGLRFSVFVAVTNTTGVGHLCPHCRPAGVGRAVLRGPIVCGVHSRHAVCSGTAACCGGVVCLQCPLRLWFACLLRVAATGVVSGRGRPRGSGEPLWR